MILRRNELDIFIYFLFLTLFCSIILFAVGKPMKFDAKENPHGFKNETKMHAENHHANAMDLILAINQRTPVTRRFHAAAQQMNEERVKRMNVTKFSNGSMVITNTSQVLNATDVMLQVNLEQKVADNLLEGDIMLDPMDPQDYKLVKLVKEGKKEEAEERIQKRQATRELKHLWHSRIVPYTIDRSLLDAYNLIQNTIFKFNTKSCVKFMPYKGERDYVIFRKNDGCSSNIGRAYVRPGPQEISIDVACQHESIIMHEMLHCVGFYHEQSRPDRDEFLKILWENVSPGAKSQFLKYSHGAIDQFGMNYNYHSIMQYGRTAFSWNNGDTMQAVADNKMELGGEDMTSEDVTELNTLYDCTTTRFNSWASWSMFTPCDRHCYKSRQRFCYGTSPKSCGGRPNAYGIETERVKCSKDVCPAKIHGHWGDWSSFGHCSENCNEGVRVRERSCDNPRPANGGKDCPGSSKHSILCILPRCSLGTYDTDFRDGHLGTLWRNDIYDTPEFDWQVGKGPTRTEGTGPSRDHLGHYGNYLYVESSGRAKGDNARIYTEYLPKTNGTCFSFYYHMFGPTTGELKLSTFASGNSQLQPLFSKTGGQQDVWHFQRVSLTSQVTYQLIFEAIVADGDYSDIAVDDLFFNEGNCDCQDSFRNCGLWAAKNDCSLSYNFMINKCRKSCNFCTCVDQHSQCRTWGEKECKKNYAYMEVACPVTCKSCACRNYHVKCVNWKNQNQCELNPIYMKKNCQRSCGVCKVPDKI